MKCCVYTRCFYENEYLTYFIQHYIDLGFDKIIILHAGGLRYNLSEAHVNFVEIHYVENVGNDLLLNYDYLVKTSDFDWILSVDNDELLLLNKKYKNISDFINEKITLNNKINTFYFRWGMIEKYDVENNNNFLFILNNYKIFSNLHIKTMFKKKDLINIIHPHFAELNYLTIYFENNIINNNQAFLPINENSYKEHILIHLHSRSLNNIVLKSFNTIFINKFIRYKDEFIEFLNNFEQNIYNDESLLYFFLKYIGVKADLPFRHKNNNLINLDEYHISKFVNSNINDSNINNDILNCLKINNINEQNYFNFINKISNIIIKDKIFIK
jgi:hypothetical protein